nr:MAG TPA: hypothetical protein [Caudoviricetes sp.]
MLLDARLGVLLLPYRAILNLKAARKQPKRKEKLPIRNFLRNIAFLYQKCFMLSSVKQKQPECNKAIGLEFCFFYPRQNPRMGND